MIISKKKIIASAMALSILAGGMASISPVISSDTVGSTVIVADATTKDNIKNYHIDVTSNASYTGSAVKPTVQVYYYEGYSEGYSKSISYGKGTANKFNSKGISTSTSIGKSVSTGEGKSYTRKVNLIQGTDYTVSYSNNIKPGTAKVTIKGKGKYTGTVTKSFKITKASIAKTAISIPKSSYTYTGKAIKPNVTVKNGLRTLKKGTDYTVSYKNNTKVGTATITVTGKGNYSGTKTKTFKIVKKKK